MAICYLYIYIYIYFTANATSVSFVHSILGCTLIVHQLNTISLGLYYNSSIFFPIEIFSLSV